LEGLPLGWTVFSEGPLPEEAIVVDKQAVVQFGVTSIGKAIQKQMLRTVQKLPMSAKVLMPFFIHVVIFGR